MIAVVVIILKLLLFFRISLKWPFVKCNEWSGLGGGEAIIPLDGGIGGRVVEKIGGVDWTAAAAVAAVIV